MFGVPDEKVLIYTKNGIIWISHDQVTSWLMFFIEYIIAWYTKIICERRPHNPGSDLTTSSLTELFSPVIFKDNKPHSVSFTQLF